MVMYVSFLFYFKYVNDSYISFLDSSFYYMTSVKI